MLKIIYGAFGSGKTYCSDQLILDALASGKSPVLLVPEQEVMEAERRIADRADENGVLCERLTVVSFRRLANLVFRKFGGIEYKELGDGGKLIVIWRILEELSPALSAYKNSRDTTLVELMLSVCNELKRYCVLPSAISRAADSLPPSLLKDKLSDIALIYSAYTAEMKDEFSDSTDDVSRLAEILKSERFFDGRLLFVDSFNGFTVPEMAVLEYAMLQCDVNVTLCLPEEKGRIGFGVVENTEKMLLDTAQKHGIPTYTSARLYPLEKYIPEEIRLVSERLWDFSYSSPEEYSSDRIRLTKCKDVFSEAEYIACQICELVRNGARYRDIAVISRSTASFDGVFDLVFEKYKIPFFFSRRQKITSTPLFRSIIAALDVISGGWKPDDLMRYIKTGICGLSAEKTDMLESYIIRWNISGRRFTDEYPWNMNPDGYTDKLTEKGKNILKEVNALRIEVRSPLVKLQDSLKNVSVKDACKALYVFLTECGAYEIYKASPSPESVTVFNTVMELFDTLVSSAGDIPVTPSIISSLLSLAAKQTDFGRIPETADCVKAGDASILRVNGIKHVFLTSCENGVFPKSIEDDSVFTDAEKEILKDKGIVLSPDTATKNDEEMFYFLRSACSAVESLNLSYVSSDNSYASVGFTRLSSLFPGNKVLSFPDEAPLLSRAQTPDSSRDVALQAFGTPLFEALKRFYTEKDKGFLFEKTLISDTDASVSPETAQMLYGKSISMTQSRIESFAKCPFAYYCSHILKLTEKKRSDFLGSDKGTYIHRILEKVVSYIFDNKENVQGLAESELYALVKSVVNDVLKNMLGSDSIDTARFSALIARLNRTLLILVKNLVDEFRQSKFVPKFFELNIGDKENGVAPLSVPLSDGSRVSVYGVIDRVDTYEKDGDVYVRVVDYKTGTREHSLKNISLGLDMQMLLYLFSICKSDSPSLLSRLGKSGDGRLIPAGVLYHPAYVSATSVDTPPSKENAYNIAEKALVRKGVLLDNEEILNAMESGLAGKYIPVTEKKDSISVAKNSELKTLEQFGELLTNVSEVLAEIGEKIKKGEASASPLKQDGIDACEFCKMRPVCRKEK